MKALEKCRTESHYINLLRRPHAEQKGRVSTEKESDMFEIKKGTKQGALFVQLILKIWCSKWH